jgi:hypothetical protein
MSDVNRGGLTYRSIVCFVLGFLGLLLRHRTVRGKAGSLHANVCLCMLELTAGACDLLGEVSHNVRGITPHCLCLILLVFPSQQTSELDWTLGSHHRCQHGREGVRQLLMRRTMGNLLVVDPLECLADVLASQNHVLVI